MKKVPLAKKGCMGSLLAPLNDQYTDGGVWSIDDKERVPCFCVPFGKNRRVGMRASKLEIETKQRTVRVRLKSILASRGSDCAPSRRAMIQTTSDAFYDIRSYRVNSTISSPFLHI